MKRVLTTAVILALSLGIAQDHGRSTELNTRPAVSTASRHHLQGERRVLKCHSILLPDRRDKARIERFIRCAGDAWNAPGTPAYWVAIARCESGLWYRSYNPNGHVGIYQHSLSAWPSRVARYIRPLNLHNTKWENPEANVIVAMRMTHATGSWVPAWSCG